MEQERFAAGKAIRMALLGICAGWVLGGESRAQGVIAPASSVQTFVVPQSELLPGENKVGLPTVTKNPDGSYSVRVDYFYRGDAGPRTHVIVRAGEQREFNNDALALVERGQGSAVLSVPRPSANPRAHRTTNLTVDMMGRSMDSTRPPPLAQASLAYPIDWPSAYQYYQRIELFKKTPADLYKEAVEEIDLGQRDSLENARDKLERLMLLAPNHSGAQIEMARYAMKTRWGPEGLAQAEKYLLSVRSKDPGNANARVLLGYVYAHQKRYKEADVELAKAAEIGTPNLWLWANWGELRVMQGREADAIEKYLQAVAGKPTYDTYDRARMDAYWRLFALLDKRRQYDRMDALHRQRVQEFPANPCVRVEFAEFRLSRFEDHETAIEQAKSAHDDGCRDSRPVLGAAYWMAWSKLQGDPRQEALNRAQVFLPEGAGTFYELARRDATAKVLAAMLKNGSSLGVADNDKMTALAHALQREDLDAARRLLRLGAKSSETVGEEAYPVALLPLMQQSIAGVELMQANGVNYSKLRFRGMSGLDIAKRMDNPALLKVIQQGPGSTM